MSKLTKQFIENLRRTFLTMGEKLDVPTYALKRLVNHRVSNDMTGRYLILDLDWLRWHMSRISDAFIELLGINALDACDSPPINESMNDAYRSYSASPTIERRPLFVAQKHADMDSTKCATTTLRLSSPKHSLIRFPTTSCLHKVYIAPPDLVRPRSYEFRHNPDPSFSAFRAQNKPSGSLHA